MSLLYITANTGVFQYDIENRTVSLLNLPAPTLGFFGIAYDKTSNRVYAASRQKTGFSLRKALTKTKRSTDVIVYSFLPGDDSLTLEMRLHNVFDVHQIAIYQNYLFLTDTALNRLHVVDLSSGARRIWNVGAKRKDIHHINAVTVKDETLYIGLNNRGEVSQILVIKNLSSLTNHEGNLEILKHGDIIDLTGLSHTHDLKPWQDTFLVCASHKGELHCVSPLKKIAKVSSDFLRGVAVSDRGIWLGLSPRIDKKSRYDDERSAHIVLLDKTNFTQLDFIEIAGAGQINDMVYIP